MSTPVRINLLPHREQKRQARQRQFVSSAVLLAVAALGCAPRLPAGDLTAGAAAVDVTPPPGVPMAGYYGVRLAEGTLDPLYARALVLEAQIHPLATAAVALGIGATVLVLGRLMGRSLPPMAPRRR